MRQIGGARQVRPSVPNPVTTNNPAGNEFVAFAGSPGQWSSIQRSGPGHTVGHSHLVATRQCNRTANARSKPMPVLPRRRTCRSTYTKTCPGTPCAPHARTHLCRTPNAHLRASRQARTHRMHAQLQQAQQLEGRCWQPGRAKLLLHPGRGDGGLQDRDEADRAVAAGCNQAVSVGPNPL